MGLGLALLSRLSVLPWSERGGVRGAARGGRSVGRSAAGIYMGDLGGRIWRWASGTCDNAAAFWIEVGEWVVGVAFPEVDVDGDDRCANCWACD